MSDIRYCERSTITEAWAVVVGLPGPVDSLEAGLFHRSLTKALPDLQRRSGLQVIVHGDRQLVTPYWSEEHSWLDGRCLIRFGHRYLSVHFLPTQEKPYNTYASTLEGPIDTCLSSYNSPLQDDTSRVAVDRVGYGYVNSFSFEQENFDVSRYFRTGVNLGVAGGSRELTKISNRFELYDSTSKHHLSLELIVDGTSGSGVLKTLTKVFAERRDIEGLSMSDKADIKDLIANARLAAKRLFFDFATEETQQRMGAVRDDS